MIHTQLTEVTSTFLLVLISEPDENVVQEHRERLDVIKRTIAEQEDDDLLDDLDF